MEKIEDIDSNEERAFDVLCPILDKENKKIITESGKNLKNVLKL